MGSAMVLATALDGAEMGYRPPPEREDEEEEEEEVEDAEGWGRRLERLRR